VTPRSPISSAIPRGSKCRSRLNSAACSAASTALSCAASLKATLAATVSFEMKGSCGVTATCDR
jgi:hypothetical protein